MGNISTYKKLFFGALVGGTLFLTYFSIGYVQSLTLSDYRRNSDKFMAIYKDSLSHSKINEVEQSRIKAEEALTFAVSNDLTDKESLVMAHLLRLERNKEDKTEYVRLRSEIISRGDEIVKDETIRKNPEMNMSCWGIVFTNIIYDMNDGIAKIPELNSEEMIKLWNVNNAYV